MIKKIEDKEIITRVEARRRYKKYYIGMIMTEEKMHDPDNALGYVVYVMDTYDEIFKIPRRFEDGTYIASMPGMAVGGTEIGSICFVD